MKVRIVNYEKMTLKQLEKEHSKQIQILLDMMNAKIYSKNDINFQKGRVDTIYKYISKKHKQISKQIGRYDVK